MQPNCRIAFARLCGSSVPDNFACPFSSPASGAEKRLDVSVSKLTRLRGNAFVELRLEVYNVTNTASFRNPSSDLSDGDFGEVTRTIGGPRVVQLAAKLRF